MRFLRPLSIVLATLSPIPLAGQRPDKTRAAPQGPSEIGVAASSGGYTVDFNDQDVRVVLSALAEAAGVNVTFGTFPEVRTTLHLAKAVPKEQLPDVMRSVAEENGLTMNTDGPVVRIGPARRREEPSSAAAMPQRSRVELYTYRLKHASAAQIAPLLMNLFAGTTLDPAAPQPNGANGNNGNDNIQPASPGSPPAPVNVFKASCVVNGQPVDCSQLPSGGGLAQALQDAISQQSGDGQQGGRRGRFARAIAAAAAAEASQVRIVAEESTNTLLIRATAQEWEWIQRIVKDVDLRPLQVLIEAVIVEVTRTKELNVGVDATVNVNRSSQRTIRSGSGKLPSTPNARDFLLQLTGGRGAVDFTAALNALATRGDLRVRSLPVIVGQNNKQALLNVGSSRPFVQVSQTVPNDPTGRVQTIQYIDVGTKLQITPRINADGYVNLEVAQTANSATNEIQFDAPVLNRREATTQVFLRDGQTTVIGGLADNTRDHSRSGIPVLRSIPVIGGLFGSTHDNDVETELYVFLTPHIISDDADIDRLRDSLQQHSKELRDEPVKPVFPSRPAAAAPDSTPVPTPAPTPTP